ncbi:MAG: hypothetical protein EPN56_05255 [Rhodanobacter sp.]|nr:MAG: hypothetical protein EPN78_01560 [Rhodanobacter sp.]TAM15145.1 MAG: hypothetical protein EPN66_00930 [Rhodanobacter sp.]TAM36385.1 MAG: hypothetical protein EPN56_05255 [Rhodanobacter sp.]
MSKHTLALTVVLSLGMVALTAAPTMPAYAAEANVKCHLDFSLSGWSIIYKRAEGSGTVRCDNGEQAAVKIKVIGGGLTAGKFRIDHGTGDITHVRNIGDVFGNYAQAGAELGVVKSGTAQVLTKGTTSLALAGHGEGINLGVSVGKFTISRR